MNHRRIAGAALAAWVVSIPLGAVIHHVILGRVYSGSSAFRPAPDTLRRLPIGYAVELVGFFAAAWLYARLASPGRDILAGLRFGLLLGLTLVSFGVVWNYVTQPISTVIGLAEVLECLVMSMICGSIIGLTYRPNVL